MNKRDWTDGQYDTYYFYTIENGRIVGQVNKIAHTRIWVCKIINNYNDEKYIGLFISSDTAMKAVEKYWDIQEMTLLEQ
jgi:hypothetical protein